MSDLKIYNSEELGALVTEATSITTGMEEINACITGSYSALDTRVQRKLDDIFSQLNRANGALGDEVGDVTGYTTWLQGAIGDLETTDSDVDEIVGGITPTDLDPTIQQTSSGNPTIEKEKQFTLDPSVIEALPEEEQELIKKKLKEVGFTDEEIKSILDGKKPVDKAKLESLSKELAKIVSEHPEVRTELKALYGFDIFNEDGSVNKDKLALAMLMDGKNPNDKYDLEAFLKKYGLSGLTGGTGDTENPNTPISETIIGDIKPGDEGVENIISGINGTTISGTDSLLDGLKTENQDILGPDASLLAGDIGNNEGIVPKINDLDVKKSGVGIGLGVAGLGGLAAAAGSLALAGKNKEDDDEEENSDELSDVEILDGDSDMSGVAIGAAGIGSLIAAELALSERDNKKKEEEKKEEEKKAFVPEAAIGEEIKPIRKDDKDRSWLYGLGIGLAGAALASDDDDEEEEEAY